VAQVVQEGEPVSGAGEKFWYSKTCMHYLWRDLAVGGEY
jgi:hypothetical protein